MPPRLPPRRTATRLPRRRATVNATKNRFVFYFLWSFFFRIAFGSYVPSGGRYSEQEYRIWRRWKSILERSGRQQAMRAYSGAKSLFFSFWCSGFGPRCVVHMRREYWKVFCYAVMLPSRLCEMEPQWNSQFSLVHSCRRFEITDYLVLRGRRKPSFPMTHERV